MENLRSFLNNHLKNKDTDILDISIYKMNTLSAEKKVQLIQATRDKIREQERRKEEEKREAERRRQEEEREQKRSEAQRKKLLRKKKIGARQK